MQIESVTVNQLEVLHVLGNACIGVVVARTRQDLQFALFPAQFPFSLPRFRQLDLCNACEMPISYQLTFGDHMDVWVLELTSLECRAEHSFFQTCVIQYSLEMNK
jgi:hypothetical protein